MNKKYNTHTGLVLEMTDNEGAFLVTIRDASSNVLASKVLYSGADSPKALKEYNYWRKHYEKRKGEEATKEE